MNIFRHTKFETLSNGTCLQGHLEFDFKTLLELLGEPKGGGSDKTDLSWLIVLQDEISEDERIHIVTVYDWKIGKNYCGDDGMDVEQNNLWNVGCHSRKGFHLLNRYIKQRLVEIGQNAIQKSA
jgi:hypothetical protein